MKTNDRVRVTDINSICRQQKRGPGTDHKVAATVSDKNVEKSHLWRKIMSSIYKHGYWHIKKVRFIIFHPEEKPKLKIPGEKHIVKILQDTGTGKDKDFHNQTPTKTGNDHKNWQVGLRGIQVSAVLCNAVWQPTKCNQSAIIAN